MVMPVPYGDELTPEQIAPGMVVRRTYRSPGFVQETTVEVAEVVKPGRGAALLTKAGNRILGLSGWTLVGEWKQ